MAKQSLPGITVSSGAREAESVCRLQPLWSRSEQDAQCGTRTLQRTHRPSMQGRSLLGTKGLNTVCVQTDRARL